MTNLDDYADRVEHKYPILGRLMWFSVSEPRIKYDDLEQRLKDLGLNTGYLPPRTRGVDAFRNATKASWRKRVKDGEITENYMLREVVCDDDHVVQHVMRETVNARNERLAYDRVGTATFYRPDGSHPHGRVLVVNEAPFFDDRLKGIVDGIAENIHSEFTDRVQFLHSNAIRGIIRNILRSINSVTVRPSGGVFFAADDHKETVAALTQLLNSFDGECHMHNLPLIDAEDQREMLVSAFEHEAVVEIERIMGDVGDLLTSGKRVTVARADEFLSQYRRLTAKLQEYQGLLDDQMERVGDTLTLFNKQVETLVAKVE
jgi:hypothetical protein